MLFVFYRNNYEYDDYYNSNQIDNVITIPSFESLFHNHFLRFAFKIVFSPRFLFPFKTKLKKKFFKHLIPKCVKDYKDKIVFIFTAKYYDNQVSFFDYLRDKYNCKIVLKLTDKISSFNNFKGVSFDAVKTHFDFCCTYNELDAHEFDISVYPPVIETYKDICPKKETKSTDVFFVGKSKGRIDKIRSEERRVGKEC